MQNEKHVTSEHQSHLDNIHINTIHTRLRIHETSLHFIQLAPVCTGALMFDAKPDGKHNYKCLK